MRKSGMRHLDIRIAEGRGFMDCIGIVDTQAVFYTVSLFPFFFSISFRFYEREYGHHLHGCV